MAPKKQIVVVGGGPAGAETARMLSQQLNHAENDLTLISAHPCFMWYIACLRMVVTEEGSLEKQALIPYDRLFAEGKGTFKQGMVTGIKAEKGSQTGGSVTLQTGESVKFDVLVLASGSKWESCLDFPWDREQMQQHIKKWRQTFASAKKVVICGGGAVGIELAGELRHYHPDHTVTIVHSDKMLLNKAYPDKYRLDVERRLRSRGVNLILDDFLEATSESTNAITRKGVEIGADLVIPARGPRPNTTWITSALGEDVANERGNILIKPTFQLASFPNIYAMGDITDLPEQKQAGKYPAHAAVVAANIKTMLKGAEPRKEYKKQPEIIVLTMGKIGGTTLLFGMMFGDWFTAMLKSKNLLISMKRKALGYSS